MQKLWLYSWRGRFFLPGIFFALGWGIHAGAAEEAVAASSPPALRQFESSPPSVLTQLDKGIWETNLGEGFRKGATEIDFALGAGVGISHNLIGGSAVSHDLALCSVRYGKVLSGVVGRDHWYAGNLELLGEGFAGAQYSPRTAYLAGGAAVIRYNFITGTRFVPFFDLAGGCLATDIKQPDLSTVFQFNEQGGPGLHYFWREDSAITFQCRYMHISNAGIKQPNAGVNVGLFSVGMSWFF